MVRICDIGEGAEGGSRSPDVKGDAKEPHVSLTSCKIFEKMRRCHHQHRSNCPLQRALRAVGNGLVERREVALYHLSLVNVLQDIHKPARQCTSTRCATTHDAGVRRHGAVRELKRLCRDAHTGGNGSYCSISL